MKNGELRLWTTGVDASTARNAKLSKKCAFTKTISLSKSKVGSAKSLKITVRFQGNSILKPTTKNLSATIKR